MLKMDEQLRKLIENAVANNPDMVEKFGNPLDKEDPRNWTPTERAEKGLSTEEQLRLLGLDVEAQAQAIASVTMRTFDLVAQLDLLQHWAADQMAKEFKALVADGKIDEAMGLMKKLMGGQAPESQPGQWGPLEDKEDASIRYAGSARGIAPDQMVETPQGLIRGDQIPGYRNDPNWRPSPDWMDANCMCPAHVAKREHDNDNPFNSDGGFGGTGLYL
jgi:hypothetical protein